MISKTNNTYELAEKTPSVMSSPTSQPNHLPALNGTYQVLLQRIGWPHAEGAEGIRTLGFTSCYPQEGVSTVAAQVAFSAALVGNQRAILIDLNFTRPAVHAAFDLEFNPGLRDILSGNISTIDAIQSTDHPHLAALPVGTPASGNTVYQTNALSDLLGELREMFDLVVVDLPSHDMASNTLSVARLLDGVCLVVEAERVRTEIVLNTKELLVGSGANLVGAVMNKQPHHVPEWLYRTL